MTRFQLILPVQSQNVTKNRTDHRMHVDGTQICRSKWGHRPKTGSVTKNQSRDGSKSLPQLWSDRFEMNRTWSPSVRAHVLFISKRSDQNLDSDFDPSRLIYNAINVETTTSAARTSALKTPYPPLPYIFWTVWTWGFTRWHPKYTIPIQKFE